MTAPVSGWLRDPRSQALDLDDPAIASSRVNIIRTKALLLDVYRQWYDELAAEIPPGPGRILELGAGAGFLTERIPNAITSDLMPAPGVDLLADGAALPFVDGAMKAIVMTDVLHHVPRPRSMFTDLARCVRAGGVVVMIEPWLSTWSRWIYGRFHHEPYEPATPTWEFESTGPLSGANLALPWVIFHRDAAIFAEEFPEWQVTAIRPAPSFRYIVSGGMSLRSLAPGATLPVWRWVDRSLRRWPETWSMFALIVLTRRTSAVSR
ncbi:MAG: methyltransferase domain-containing protein [Vicinamibacterales bacterium]